MDSRPSILVVSLYSFILCAGIILLLNVFFEYYAYSSALRSAQNLKAENEIKIKEHKIDSLALRKVRFTLNDSSAKEVYVVADFSLWEAYKIKLEQQKAGVFSGLIVLPQGEYKYYFEVDGKPVADPSNTDFMYYSGKTVSLKTVN